MFYHFKDLSLIQSPIFDEYMPFRGSFIHTFIYGWVFDVFPESMYAHRYITVVLALIVLGFLYLVCRFFSDKKTALITVLIISLLGNFVRSAHMARPEILIMFFMYGGFLLQVYAGKKWHYILAAFVMGCCVTIHPIGFLAVVLALCFEFLRTDLSSRQVFHNSILPMRTRLLLVIVGLACASLIFFLDNIIFIKQIINEGSVTLNYLQKTYVAPLFERLNIILLKRITIKSLFDWIQIGLPLILLILLLIVNIGSLNKIKVPLILFIVLFTIFILLGRINILYVTIFMPFLWLCIVILCRQRRGKIIFWLQQIILFCLVFGNMTIFAGIYHREANANAADFIAQVQAIKQKHIDVKSSIIGLSYLWYQFKEQPFQSINTNADVNPILQQCHNVLIIPQSAIPNKADAVDKLNPRLGADQSMETHANKISRATWRMLEPIAVVKDKHYGGFSITQNNTLVFMQNTRNCSGQ